MLMRVSKDSDFLEDRYVFLQATINYAPEGNPPLDKIHMQVEEEQIDCSW